VKSNYIKQVHVHIIITDEIWPKGMKEKSVCFGGVPQVNDCTQIRLDKCFPMLALWLGHTYPVHHPQLAAAAADVAAAALPTVLTLLVDMLQ
jgi:hypothetical protein